MSKAIAVTLIIAALVAAQRAPVAMEIAPTPTPEPTLAPAPDVAPPCALDWGLPVTSENVTAIIRCYKLLQGAGLIDISNWPCPPAGSDWEPVFNTYYCFRVNHPDVTMLPPTATPETGYP